MLRRPFAQKLSRDDYKYLKLCGSKLDIMYGLCEIHKGTAVNDPLSLFQPILSAIGTTLVVPGL